MDSIDLKREKSSDAILMGLEGAAVHVMPSGIIPSTSKRCLYACAFMAPHSLTRKLRGDRD
jgi:hypothetical protein